MKKISLLILTAFAALTLHAQNVPDLIRTSAAPSIGANKNNRATVDANLKAYLAFLFPRGASFSLNGAKDSSGYGFYNTVLQRMGFYQGGSVWYTAARREGENFTGDISSPIVRAGRIASNGNVGAMSAQNSSRSHQIIGNQLTDAAWTSYTVGEQTLTPKTYHFGLDIDGWFKRVKQDTSSLAPKPAYGLFSDMLGTGLTFDTVNHKLNTIQTDNVTVSNGLTKTGNDIKLGGSITEPVIVDVEGFNSLAFNSHFLGSFGTLEAGFGGVALRSQDTVHNSLYYVSATGSGAHSGYVNFRTFEISGIDIDSTEMIITDSRNNKGLTYRYDHSVKGKMDSLWIPNWGAVKSIIPDSNNIVHKTGIEVIPGNKSFTKPVTVTDTTNGSALTLTGNGTALTVNGYSQFNSLVDFEAGLQFNNVNGYRGFQFYKTGEYPNFYQLVFDPVTNRFGYAYNNGSFNPFAYVGESPSATTIANTYLAKTDTVPLARKIGSADMVQKSYQGNYILLNNQASTPATPTTGVKLFVNSSNNLSWLNSNGRTTNIISPYPNSTRSVRLPYKATSTLLDSLYAVNTYARKDSTIAAVNTIANLQSYTGTSTTLILKDTLRGKNAPIFNYYPAVSTYDNGVSFAATGKGSGAWVREISGGVVYPEWWGAVPYDGGATFTDARVAIQAAINSSPNKASRVIISNKFKYAGTLYYGQSTEIIGSNVAFPKQYFGTDSLIYFIKAGLFHVNSGGQAALRNTNQVVNYRSQFPRLKDLVIIGTNRNIDTAIVFTDNPLSTAVTSRTGLPVMENCYIDGFYVGVDARKGGDSFYLNHNHFSNMGGFAIRSGEIGETFATNNDFFNIDSVAVESNGFHEVWMNSEMEPGISAIGYLVKAGKFSSFSHDRFTAVKNAFVFKSGSSRNSVDHAMIRNSTSHSIIIDGGFSQKIDNVDILQGTEISDPTVNFIYARKTSNLQLINNRYIRNSGATTTPIRLDTVSSITSLNNTVEGWATTDIAALSAISANSTFSQTTEYGQKNFTGAVIITGALRQLGVANLGVSTAVNPVLTILGGSSGTAIMRERRTSGVTSVWEHILTNGYGLRDSVTANVPFTIYSDVTTENQIFAGARAKATADTRQSTFGGTTFSGLTNQPGNATNIVGQLGTGNAASPNINFLGAAPTTSGTTTQGRGALGYANYTNGWLFNVGGVKAIGITSIPMPGEVLKLDGANNIITAVRNIDYLPVNNAALTGISTAPTAAPSTNTIQLATTAFVQQELTNSGRTRAFLNSNITLALNGDYLATTSTLYSGSLPSTTGFLTDGSKLIVVAAIGTAGAKITCPAGYVLRGLSGTATSGTGDITIIQDGKVQIAPVGVNTYEYYVLSGSVTVH